MTLTCSNCSHFKKNMMELGKGFCFRYPPTAFFINGNIGSSNPPVMSDATCGEHKLVEIIVTEPMGARGNGNGV